MEEILNKIQGWASAGIPVAPGVWVDEAFKLLAYVGSENDKLADLETQVALEKWNYKFSHKCSDAEAESYKRTLDIFNKMKKQEALVKLLDEYIRMAKKRATLADTEIKY
jgi:hypothetical protein